MFLVLMKMRRIKSYLNAVLTLASVNAVTFHATLTIFPGLDFREKNIKLKTFDLIGIELYHRFFLFSISH